MMKNAKVEDLMLRNPVLIAPDATLRNAASIMETVNCGVLPVGTEKKIEGVITDRDIVIRALAKSKNPEKEKVRDFMTKDAYFCHEGDTLKSAAEIMKKNNISRLIVKNANGDVSGILSFGAVLRENANVEEIADAMTHVARRKKAA